MRTLFAVSIGLAVLAGSAIAADETEMNMAGYPATNPWAGFYAGVHFGLAAADFGGAVDTSSTTRPVDTIETEPKGVIGGAQIGYNWAHGGYIFGIEADITATDLSESIKASGPDASALAGLVDIQSSSVDYLATARLRGGRAFDQFLIYATAGVAHASADFEFFDDESASSGSLDFDDLGFVVGAGIEGAVMDSQWSWRLEGLYYHFGDSRSASSLTGDNDPGDKVEFEDILAVRLGVNYQFGTFRH